MAYDEIIVEVYEKTERANELMHEMLVSPEANRISDKTQHSIIYARLKNVLLIDIVKFCREQIALRSDLQILRLNVGEYVSEEELLKYAKDLEEKWNNRPNNIGITTHLETTLFDYSLVVFVVIKRDKIYTHKFVFRFRKPSVREGLFGLDLSGIEK